MSPLLRFRWFAPVALCLLAVASASVPALVAQDVGVRAYLTPGNTVGVGRQFVLNSPWLALFSGAAITLAVLAFNLVGDALRDVLDPRLRV